MNRGQMSVTDQVNVQFHVQQQQIDLHLKKKIDKVKLLMIMLVKNSHYFFNSRKYLGLVLL